MISRNSYKINSASFWLKKQKKNMAEKTWRENVRGTKKELKDEFHWSTSFPFQDKSHKKKKKKINSVA